MKRAIGTFVVVTVGTLLLAGCWEPKAEKKAKEQQQQAASESFWNITPPDRSKDEGFKP
ncbi:hypothetical protein D9M68_763400 [compost metagenome]|uniref:Uncharacterized protein n=1 Tax=Pseudomonas jinjuensis TaxID=198616 RepID=A0A1H0KCC6_9PSED|nr:hypothetical protein [Pseudomonas jinjuensis]SDO53421.1 hypothetical protein SAMN05216193_112123 [Pseudomonas jinjuensis]